MNKKNQKKRIQFLAISIIATLLNSNNVFAKLNYSANIKQKIESLSIDDFNEEEQKKLVEECVMEQLETKEEFINRCIITYHLESDQTLIYQHQPEFLDYTNGIIHNPNISKSSYEALLSNFWFIVKYGDYPHQLENIKKTSIEVLSYLKESLGTLGICNDETSIYIDDAATNDVIRHEDLHRILQLGKSYMFFKNGKYLNSEMVKKGTFERKDGQSILVESDDYIAPYFWSEAIAEDLSSTKNDNQGFAVAYEELTNILQGFYFLWGKDQFLNQLKDPKIFPDYLYHQMASYHFSDSEINNVFKQLMNLRVSYYTDSNISSDSIKTSKEIIKNSFINMYEQKTNESVKDSIEMNMIMASFLFSNDKKYDGENREVVYENSLENEFFLKFRNQYIQGEIPLKIQIKCNEENKIGVYIETTVNKEINVSQYAYFFEIQGNEILFEQKKEILGNNKAK